MTKTFASSNELKEYLKTTTKFKENYIWHSTYQLINALLLLDERMDEVIEEIKDFINFQEQFNASDKTHYSELDDWSSPSYDKVHDYMAKYKDIEEYKAVQNVWYEIYDMLGSIIWSPHLKSEVAHHHSSANSRKMALIRELSDAISFSKIIATKEQ